MTLAQQTPAVTPRPRGLRRNGRWTGLVYLFGARVKELQREPEMAFWVFAFPILLALGLGVAFRNKPADVTSIAIVTGPGAENALSLIQHSPEKAAIRARVMDMSQALLGFRLGKFDLVVQSDGRGGIQYRYDPTRPESVLSRAEVDDALQSAAGRREAIPTSSVTSSEPGSRYIDFLIPGLLGMNQMNAAMWGIGFALVEMRQRKLLKRFVATPMRRSDFLLALTGSRLLMMTVQMVLLLAFGVLLFHMRLVGSLLTIFLIAVTGSVSFGGLGLLAACRAQKIETASGIINVVMMPMWIFSGVFFSYERFPAMLQPFIQALPLTALNDALRDAILEGSSLASQSGRLLLLLLWGGISFLLSLRWFRWT
jgi:ABC-2 type transport system permease protein